MERTDVARAKVNLTLRVVGRRPDGYHELDSLVAFADFGDVVSLDATAPPGVDVRGAFAGAIDGENLCSRALAVLAAERTDVRLGRIVIDKTIPVAAGLGGGSADAAAVLRLVRAINGEQAADVDWMALAGRLGSDVPVCLQNTPCRMTGRGDCLHAVPSMAALYAVLVNPMIVPLSDKTRQVFQRLDAPLLKAPVDQPEALFGAQNGWAEVIAAGGNDLEEPAAAMMPAIEDILSRLRSDQRTRVARLSGAGPTCFALVDSWEASVSMASDLARQLPGWWVRAVRLG